MIATGLVPAFPDPSCDRCLTKLSMVTARGHSKLTRGQEPGAWGRAGWGWQGYWSPRPRALKGVSVWVGLSV